MALLSFAQYVAAHPDQINELPQNTMWAQGVGTFEWYPLQIDPATGLLQTNASGGGGGGISGGGIFSNVTVGTSAVLAAVGGSSLADRISLTVFNADGAATIFWGYDNTVTIANGTPIPIGRGMSWVFDSTGTQDVWLISGSAGTDARVTEAL